MTTLYGITPAPFAEGINHDRKAGTMRFTVKDKFLYAIDLGNEVLEMEEADQYTPSLRPEAPFVIPDVIPVEGSEVFMLGVEEALPWHTEGDDLVIEKIPDPLPCDYAWAFKIQVLE